MTCSFCTPKGWKKMCCNICGAGSEGDVYISIMIATDSDDSYPYSQTDLCKKCFEKYGVESAINHNIFCRDQVEK